MADNATLAQGALTVATEEDSTGVHHQKMVVEFAGGPDRLTAVSPATPMPVSDDASVELHKAILVELRVLNEQLYALMNSECEPLEMLRNKYKEFPVTL
jgi:hypothetical protein